MYDVEKLITRIVFDPFPLPYLVKKLGGRQGALDREPSVSRLYLVKTLCALWFFLWYNRVHTCHARRSSATTPGLIEQIRKCGKSPVY